MKKEYISPAIKTEDLVTQDTLYTSKPDNSNQDYSSDIQTSFLRELPNFFFHFDNE